jgi:hypothetical protein
VNIVTRFAAAAASAAGALLLILAVVLAAADMYYRPTIEYAYTSGRGVALPRWLTADVITGIVATMLAASGWAFLSLGRRCRRP